MAATAASSSCVGSAVHQHGPILACGGAAAAHASSDLSGAVRHLSQVRIVRRPVAADLQDLVDDAGRRASAGPVSVEDRRWRLLAFSAHTELEDRVRQASILARAAPPAVATWLDTLGLEQVGDLVDTPANRGDRDGGADVRAGPPRAARCSASSWVIPGPAPLDDDERAALVAMAAEAARRPVAAAGGGRARGRVARRAARRRGRRRRGGGRPTRWPPHRAGPAPGGAFAAALAEGGDDPAEVAQRARRRWHAGDLVWRERDGLGTALAHLTPRPRRPRRWPPRSSQAGRHAAARRRRLPVSTVRATRWAARGTRCSRCQRRARRSARRPPTTSSARGRRSPACGTPRAGPRRPRRCPRCSATARARSSRTRWRRRSTRRATSRRRPPAARPPGDALPPARARRGADGPGPRLGRRPAARAPRAAHVAAGRRAGPR